MTLDSCTNINNRSTMIDLFMTNYLLLIIYFDLLVPTLKYMIFLCNNSWWWNRFFFSNYTKNVCCFQQWETLFYYNLFILENYCEIQSVVNIFRFHVFASFNKIGATLKKKYIINVACRISIFICSCFIIPNICSIFNIAMARTNYWMMMYVMYQINNAQLILLYCAILLEQELLSRLLLHSNTLLWLWPKQYLLSP